MKPDVEKRGEHYRVYWHGKVWVVEPLESEWVVQRPTGAVFKGDTLKEVFEWIDEYGRVLK